MTLFMLLKFFCSLCSLIFSPESVVWMLKLPAIGEQNESDSSQFNSSCRRHSPFPTTTGRALFFCFTIMITIIIIIVIIIIIFYFYYYHY